MFKRLVTSALLFGTAALAPPLHAQTSCAIRGDLVETLDARYGETPTGGGLVSEQRLLEIWTAPETGTWTVLMTDAQGRSCILATGTDWHQKSAISLVPGQAG